MLDRIPAFARHLIIVFTASFMAVVLRAVLAAGGVTGLDFLPVAQRALDAASVTTAGIMLTLYILPITRQYGVGKGPLRSLRVGRK